MSAVWSDISELKRASSQLLDKGQLYQNAPHEPSRKAVRTWLEDCRREAGLGGEIGVLRLALAGLMEEWLGLDEERRGSRDGLAVAAALSQMAVRIANLLRVEAVLQNGKSELTEALDRVLDELEL